MHQNTPSILGVFFCVRGKGEKPYGIRARSLRRRFAHLILKIIIFWRKIPYGAPKRCKADHILIAKRVLDKFIAEIERFKLLRKARLEYIYLDYLNKNFYDTFKNEYPEVNPYAAYCYAGMLYNVSIAWLDGGCAEPAEALRKQ